MSNGAGAVFSTIPTTGELVRLDTRTMTVEARWKTGCERPTPIATDVTTRRLFVGCRDCRLLIVDATDGHRIATVPIGELTDTVTFDTRTRTVAVTCGGGGTSLIHEEGADRYAAVGTIDTPRGARTMALDPSSGRLFTVTADIASVEPAIAERPYPLLHTKPATFRLVAIDSVQQ